MKPKTMYRVVLSDSYNGLAFVHSDNRMFTNANDAISAADEHISRKIETIPGSIKVTIPGARYTSFVMLDNVECLTCAVWPVVFDGNTVTYRDFEFVCKESGLAVSLLDNEMATCVDINDALMFVDSFILSSTIQVKMMERMIGNQ